MKHDALRASFEAWALAEGYSVDKCRNGLYQDACPAAAWDAWQAQAKAQQQVTLSVQQIEALAAFAGLHEATNATHSSETRITVRMIDGATVASLEDHPEEAGIVLTVISEVPESDGAIRLTF